MIQRLPVCVVVASLLPAAAPAVAETVSLSASGRITSVQGTPAGAFSAIAEPNSWNVDLTYDTATPPDGDTPLGDRAVYGGGGNLFSNFGIGVGPEGSRSRPGLGSATVVGPADGGADALSIDATFDAGLPTRNTVQLRIVDPTGTAFDAPVLPSGFFDFASASSVFVLSGLEADGVTPWTAEGTLTTVTSTNRNVPVSPPDIPTPAALPTLALAGFGLLRRRRA